MTDTLTATDFVIAKIKSDAQIQALADDRVYLDQIPPQIAAVFPYVIVGKVPGPPAMNASADIIMFDDLVQVSVYDKSLSPAAAATILNRAIAILHKISGSTTGGVVIGCVFETEIPLPVEVDSGIVYQHKSAQFRVYSQ